MQPCRTGIEGAESLTMLPSIPPIHPRRVAHLPRGREWVYEVKLDGFRGTLYIEGGRARFLSKTARPMARFRDLAASLAAALSAKDAILDGEIVVMSERGPEFNALMMSRAPAQFAAFDLMWLNGRDLRESALWRRKKALQRLVSGSPIGYVESTNEPKLIESVEAMDLEGIVAKRRGDPYSPQTEWLKILNASYTQKEGRWELFHRRE